MAQAARLNLRMQKEIKLLITDPPPGASFPHLSHTSDLSSFSLTTINARKYPFQPPVVTFGTPIYHPNIDTGGRICLDILNLPPKGAWQPSLNISTVLTSIGLLLSEPNPDDGLMCEASREYKYNKQVFDQKARSMTEKYARSGASPNHVGLQFVTDSIMSEDKPPKPVKTDLCEYAASFKKLSGTGRKLSLDASCSESNTKSDMGMNEITSNTLFQSQIQEPKQDSKDMSFEYGKDHVLTVIKCDHDKYNKPQAISSKKLCLSSKNLEVEILDSTVVHDLDAQKENLLKDKPPAISSKKLCLSSKNLEVEILDSTVLHDLDAQKENLLKDRKKSNDGNCFTNQKRKKLGLTGKKPSFGFLGKPQNRKIEDQVKARGKGEISIPVVKLPRKPFQVLEEKHNHNMNLKTDAEILDANVSKNDDETFEQGLCDAEGVIVLDSEDSEEEKPAASSSRRLIARKRVLGKC